MKVFFHGRSVDKNLNEGLKKSILMDYFIYLPLCAHHDNHCMGYIQCIHTGVAISGLRDISMAYSGEIGL